MTARKKPGIATADLSLGWAERLTTCVEVLMGRRGGRVERMAVTAAKVTAAPTAAEFNAVVDDLNAMKARFNELLDQLQD